MSHSRYYCPEISHSRIDYLRISSSKWVILDLIILRLVFLGLVVLDLDLSRIDYSRIGSSRNRLY